MPADVDPELRREVESLLAQNTQTGILGDSLPDNTVAPPLKMGLRAAIK